MATKRFTDDSKWRNEWFRTLPLKAKLAWVFLCDECDYAGIWKADYGLATFQLDFNLTKQQLADWFGDKIHFFGDDLVLIIRFFEFQYGSSKDSWNAKVSAKARLESLGFEIIDNRVLVSRLSGDCPPTVADSPPSVLSTGTGKGKGKGIFEKGVGKTLEPHPLVSIWNQNCGKLPKVRKCDDRRLANANKALQEEPDLEFWVTAARNMAASTWCNGGPDRKEWIADFDFFIRPGKANKAVEGSYNRNSDKKTEMRLVEF